MSLTEIIKALRISAGFDKTNTVDQRVIHAISRLTGDDFCEELDIRAAFHSEELTERERVCHAKLSAIYQLAHSHDRSASCYRVHDNWRAELPKYEADEAKEV